MNGCIHHTDILDCVMHTYITQARMPEEEREREELYKGFSQVVRVEVCVCVWGGGQPL